jgi:hypothetical protein
LGCQGSLSILYHLRLLSMIRSRPRNITGGKGLLQLVPDSVILDVLLLNSQNSVSFKLAELCAEPATIGELHVISSRRGFRMWANWLGSFESKMGFYDLRYSEAIGGGRLVACGSGRPGLTDGHGIENLGARSGISVSVY